MSKKIYGLMSLVLLFMFATGEVAARCYTVSAGIWHNKGGYVGKQRAVGEWKSCAASNFGLDQVHWSWATNKDNGCELATLKRDRPSYECEARGHSGKYLCWAIGKICLD